MNFVIIGSGQAAAQIIISLTQKKFQGTITVIGDEPYLPYQRPPLSKKFLSGALDEEQLFFRPQNFYDTHGIRLVLGQAAVRLERDNQRVICADGREFAYDKLVFATGAHPRPFKHNLGNIFNLHRLDDVKAIHPHLLSGRRLVIIGGGFIGLEVAASARQLGLDVVVLEAEARPLMRAAHEQISRFLMRVHAEEGVIIRPQCQVAEFIGTEGVSGVVLQTGEQFTADLVIIGIGVLPNSALAEAAGLEVDNGIMVDAYGQTSDGDIYAAGDCTNHPNELLGCRLRLESVHNAIEQAKTVASALCNQPRIYQQIPWFWSDQYDVKLQMAGLNNKPSDYVMRGSADNGRSFALFHFAEQRLICVEAVNRPAEFMAARRLIEAGGKISPDKLVDETIAPKQWLA